MPNYNKKIIFAISVIISFISGVSASLFFTEHPLKINLNLNFDVLEKKAQTTSPSIFELSEKAAQKHPTMYYIPKNGDPDNVFYLESEDWLIKSISFSEILPDEEDKYNYYFSRARFKSYARQEIFDSHGTPRLLRKANSAI